MNEEEPGGRQTGEPDWDALARYLTGESSAAEAEEVLRWIARDSHHRELVEGLADLLSSARSPEPADLDVEAALARVRERIAGSPIDALPMRRPGKPAAASPHRPRHAWGLKIAAGVMLVLAAALLFRMFIVPGPSDIPLRYATATGERQEVLFRDGTRAVLGPGSEVIVDGDYGADRRVIRLSGEGYFEVAGDGAGIFTVLAGEAVIRDLGTAFSVRTGPAGSVEVVVAEGRVQLGRATAGDDEGLVLGVGDRGVMDPAGQISSQEGAASADDLAWTRGELVFREAGMERVADDLRRWYGLELRIADDDLAARHLTASFAGEPPNQVARIIGLALGARADLVGDTLFLSPAGGSP